MKFELSWDSGITLKVKTNDMEFSEKYLTTTAKRIFEALGCLCEVDGYEIKIYYSGRKVTSREFDTDEVRYYSLEEIVIEG